MELQQENAMRFLKEGMLKRSSLALQDNYFIANFMFNIHCEDLWDFPDKIMPIISIAIISFQVLWTFSAYDDKTSDSVTGMFKPFVSEMQHSFSVVLSHEQHYT